MRKIISAEIGDVVLAKLPLHGRIVTTVCGVNMKHKAPYTVDYKNEDGLNFGLNPEFVIKNFGKIDITTFEEDYPEWVI
jgi:hypothetical protein